MFNNSEIQGVVIRPLKRYSDHRGWLVELYREDELDAEFLPVMSYISMTNPGVARGPHEHAEQADLFGFLGPSNFKVFLWDNRKDSPTYMNKQVIIVGESEPASVLVPPGVVHAYKNIGDTVGMVTNYPNRLFAGKGRKEPVDEIRHENNANTIYILD
ncbi:MAG: dTDP-4-dehydrorhamnose 3,5-epimerase family protein [Bacteroidota bacterium]|nr:dTDP-4-dehydrorhamnose 3,5-epimerase family protein [Bacteroidota bacterium]